MSSLETRRTAYDELFDELESLITESQLRKGTKISLEDNFVYTAQQSSIIATHFHRVLTNWGLQLSYLN